MKKVLVMSLIVNAIFMVAVSYMAIVDIPPRSTPPLFIYATNAPVAQVGDLAIGPQ